MTSTEQLEREAELCRQQLLGTVNELRSRLTPRQMVDQAINYVSDGDGAEFARNLKSQVLANPLPATLMSAGLAWLMISGKSKPSARDADAMMKGMDDSRDRPSDAAGAAADVGQAVKDKASAAAGSVLDTAASAVTSIGDTYVGVAERATRGATAAADAARGVGASASATGRTIADFCRDQPLVLAGLGVAIGAVLGAWVPSSTTEDSLMGEAADEVKDEVRQAASATYEKAATVVETAFEAGAEEASKQGLTDLGDTSTSKLDADAPLVPDHDEGRRSDDPAFRPASVSVREP